MARRSNRILQTLLLGMLTVAPLVLRAQNFDASSLQRAMQNGQSGTLYGSNPYEQTEDEEGQQQPQDTTKKERKIRKPLESYFFSDSIRALNNFMWHVKRDFNRVEIGPLDTMLTDYRIDYPFYREDVGDIAQGALGQTSLPLNYFRRPRFFDFSFASPYYAYTYNMENVPFYNTKRPMIRMNYTESGQKRYREENFGIMVAQNISPTTGFNVDYKSRGTRGQYLWSRTKNHNLSLAVSHTGRRYSIHAGYYNNHIEQQENGGVVGKWAIADTTFSMASGVPMRLADAEAQNTYRNNAFFVTQSYGIPLQRLTESDFSMGLANRLNARMSDVVCLSFPSDKVDGLRYVLTGNPVRRDVAALAGRHVEQERDLVLVLGGSQGASQINDLVYSGLERLCPRYSVVHQCGSHGDMTRSAVRYRQVEFIDEELSDLMARARVVVSRAGANAIAEICTLGKCSLLVPLTHATRGDQVENAAALESRGACRVYRDGDDFVDLVVSLMEDDALNEGISKAAIAEGRGDAAGHIARIVLGVANGQRNTDRLAEPFTR